ncbi:MAG: transcriptional regulator [Thermodesulfobacteriota bacterium]
MQRVDSLLGKIKDLLAPLEEKIRGHPYLADLEGSKIGREKLKYFAGEQHHIITSDLRSVGLLLSRHGIPPGRDFFWMVLQGETEALKALGRFVSALGVPGEELEAYEPLPEAQAYKAYMAWLSLYGSGAEVAGAFLTNFPAWGANCGRMSKALMEGYGFKGKDLSFFELFSTPVADFEEKARLVINAGISQGVEPKAIKEASRMLQGYELMFWDALYKISSR